MNPDIDRVDVLIIELRALNEKYKALEEKYVCVLRSSFDTKTELDRRSGEADVLAEKLRKKTEEVGILKKRNSALVKSTRGSLRRKENDAKKHEGSSKSKSTYLLQCETDKLRSQNSVYKGFIENLAAVLHFDSAIFESLSEIVDGSDDPVIKLFVEKVGRIHAVSAHNHT